MAVTRTVGLRDGRRLGYGEAGPANGEAVLYLHGAIGAPLRRSASLESTIEELRIRYLAVSRPGFGASDCLPGRTLLQHADDVEQLADALGLGRFAVVGVSTGAPYALACASALPERVHAAAAVSSLSPLRGLAPSATPLHLRLALGLLARAPQLCSATGTRVVRLLDRHPDLLLRAMVTGAPRADRSLLDDSAASQTAAMSFLAAARGGVDEMITDYTLCMRPWGFEPSAIDTAVHIWHGMQDQLVPPAHALALASAISGSRLALDPDDGHSSSAAGSGRSSVGWWAPGPPATRPNPAASGSRNRPAPRSPARGRSSRRTGSESRARPSETSSPRRPPARRGR
jgi:pimeloyl-ACP methyl ester carboxylesterase